MFTQKRYIGIDLGGTKIAGVMVDEEGQVLAEEVVPTLAGEGEAKVIGRIESLIQSLAGKVNRETVAGVGICAPGPLNIRTGMVIDAPNLMWKNVPIVSILRNHLGLPVILENDANAAAFGECCYGAGKGTRDMLYITVSTGIGGGIIANGQLVYGRDYSAGEIGHMIILPEGPLCGCGRRGCIEAIASGPAIAREARSRLEKGEKSVILEMVKGDPARLTAQEVAVAAGQGDKLALSVLDRAFRFLGLAIMNLIHLLNPEIIVIGGGVAKMGALLFDRINNCLKEQAFSHMVEGLPVVPAELHGRAGTMGMVALLKRKLAE